MTENLTLQPIGIVHSQFTSEEGTPVQPALSDGAPGWVEVYPEYEEALRGVDGFERVWLVFWLHRSGEAKLTVTPYLSDEPQGLFATRAPARPNPLGMSSVRVTGLSSCRLDIAEVDILDGTPLLDIKPYVPRFDSFAVERTGWYGELPEQQQAVKRFTR